MATENRRPPSDRAVDNQDLSRKDLHLEQLRKTVEQTKALYDSAAADAAEAERSGNREWMLSAKLAQGALMLVYSQALTEFTRYLLEKLGI